MYSGLQALPLLAIPCFILAGSIMQSGGISKRLINVANKFVGNTVGGLGTVTIVACLFFGAISGSSPATVAAIGAIMIPAMVKYGYHKEYSTGLIAVSGGLGVIVPPSIPLVVYGVATNTSIGDLFLAGFGPALVVAACLFLVAFVFSKKRDYRGTGDKFSFKELIKAIWDAKWALIMPIIILGGIYGGVFTPTEAGVVACAYAVVVGFFVYKELTFKNLAKVLLDNTTFVGQMMLTFAPAAALGGILAMLDVPNSLVNTLMAISTNKYVILLLINVALVFIGMIIDTTTAIIILAPILLAALEPYGINPVHLGLIITVNLAIGFCTPPVAINLFVASSISEMPVDKVARVAMPFIIALFVALLIITFFPQISLGILSLFG
jgi:C4-dicarboxylate transporter DctM subunit